MAWILCACADPGADSAATKLPPEDSFVDTSPDTFFVDTAIEDTGGEVTPEHVLTISHEGSWLLSPEGGPWSAMTGSLAVTELLDGDVEAPTCLLVYALTGVLAETDGPGCVATFTVHHYLSEGSLDTCMDPDLPADGEDRTLGWNDTDGVIVYDVGDAGVWVDWYGGERVQDEITFAWTTEVGVTVDEEG